MSDDLRKTPDLPSHTFAQKNPKSGLIEIIDMYSGQIVAVQRQPLDLLSGHRELFAEHVLPTGERVLLQTGVDPGALVHSSAEPFSQMKVDMICQLVAEGGSLTKICKQPGMPSYTTLARWRRVFPHIVEQLEQAKQDRAEFFRDAAVGEASDATSSKDPINAHALRVDTYKWAAGVDDPGRYSPRAKIEATLNLPTQIIVATGIDRTPLVERDVHEKGYDGSQDTNALPGEQDGAPRAQDPHEGIAHHQQPGDTSASQEPGLDVGGAAPGADGESTEWAPA